MTEIENYRSSMFDFPYEVFNIVLSKKSFLDIKRLDIENEADAYEYLKNYGFDINLEYHKDQVAKILVDSKKFIQTYLLEDPHSPEQSLVMPPELLFEDDPLKLLMLASNPQRNLMQRWSCALLRVAHTVTHVDNDLAKYFFPGIKKQILSVFMSHLDVTRDGDYFLGDGEDKIKLKLFEMKSEKTRDSMIMKLLHKKESVGAAIFDRVGVRIVTRTKLDVLLVLKYLAEKHVISFANINPARTRNNIIDTEKFLTALESLKNSDKQITEEDAINFLEEHTVLDEAKRQTQAESIIRESNPYSSTQYTSLQLTLRKLINIQDPFNITLSYKFFFPFEIQILDEDSYEESRHGRASHDEYKKKQAAAVRKRVLGNVLSYLSKDISQEEFDVQ